MPMPNVVRFVGPLKPLLLQVSTCEILTIDKLAFARITGMHLSDGRRRLAIQGQSLNFYLSSMFCSVIHSSHWPVTTCATLTGS